MAKRNESIIGPAAVLLSGLLLTRFAAGAPTISGVSGSINHGATVSLSGAAFGTKSAAAPVVWDNASGSNVLDKWDLAWPNNNAAYNLTYRAPQRGISLPHSHVTRYLAGAHAGTGANGGADVMVWKDRTITSYPAYTYASWYQRADDAWVFDGNDNYKVFDFSHDTGGYDLPYNWYIEYNARPSSRSSGAAWHMIDDAFGQSGASLDGPTSNWWYGSAVNPMSGSWSKIEVQIKYTNQSDGYIKLWENGVLKVNYTGHTDRYAGNLRTEGIGGYASSQNQPNNWRYFSDIYLDYTPARVVLANNASLSQATIIEPQIPQSWSSGSIDISVNLGKFASGQTAYLVVVDGGGNASTGYPVTVGGSSSGGSTSTTPLPPSNFTAH